MSDLPLHPALVHLPLALAVLVPFTTAGVLVAWHSNRQHRRVFAIATLMQLLLVASGALAMQAGERDAEAVEGNVSHAAIEQHEGAAERFVYAGAGLAALFVAVSLVRDEPTAKVLGIVAALGSVAVFALACEVGDAGGRLVYREGAASAYASSSRNPASQTHSGVSMRGRDED